MKLLTRQQERVLGFIEAFSEREHKPPSYRDIQTHFGFASPRAAQDHVTALERKGLVRRSSGSRGLFSLRPSARQVPLVGRIAAGTPIEAIENVESHLDFSSFGLDNSTGSYFALRVKGSSMIGAHILDGDIVIIKKQSEASPRDIVAVLWDGEATLKYLKKHRNGWLLIPANESLSPVHVSEGQASSFEVLGKVVQCFRSL